MDHEIGTHRKKVMADFLANEKIDYSMTYRKFPLDVVVQVGTEFQAPDRFGNEQTWEVTQVDKIEIFTDDELGNSCQLVDGRAKRIK